MTATTVIKKRRASPTTVLTAPQNIQDIAVEPLTHVASFLPAPSRAMFALALSSEWCWGDKDEAADSVCWIDREAGLVCSGSAKIAGEYDTLDFGDIEEELAKRLTDDHISDILLCLERLTLNNNRIRKLRLTNCINITGKGLWRLRKSKKIEQIDLSMVPEHTIPSELNPATEGRLEFRHVVEVLDSIVSLQRSSLKYLHLPRFWRCYPVTRVASSVRSIGALEPQINEFFTRYKQMWEKRVNVCASCTSEFKPQICTRDSNGHAVMQENTCSICLKHYCFACEYENGKELIALCSRCERVHCQDCMKMEHCLVCDQRFCGDHCGGSEVWKKNHRQHNYEECPGCDEKICGRCCFGRTCSQCNYTDCGSCRVYEVFIPERVLSRQDNGQNLWSFPHVLECEHCDLTWCRSCKDWKECDDCDVPVICEECVSERTCHSCDKSFCYRCRSIAECQGCHKNWCSDCDPQRAWGRDGRGGYCIDCAET